MSIAGQIREHRLGSGEGFLGINHPVDFTHWGEDCIESAPVDEVCIIAEEPQFPGFVQPYQPFQNETPVQSGQNTDGEKEVLAAGDPLCPICRQAAARYYHVDVGVVRHGRSPGMKYRCDAYPRAEVLRISGNLDHCVRARPHQQVVDLSFVLMRDIGDGLWQGEYEVKVPHGQQLGLPGCQPGFGSTGLTLRTVTVAARIVRDVFMGAIFAARHMPTKRRRSATLDCTHHLHLIQADMPLISRAPSSAMVAEDICNLQRWTRHGGLRRSSFPLPALNPVQIIKWAIHRRDHPNGDTGAPCRCREFGVTQQRLDDPDIDTTLQQMGRKGMA